MFIDLFVGEVDLGATGDDERELHFLWTRALALQEHGFNAGENQFAHRAPVGGSLRLQLPVEGGGNVNRGANGILFHKLLLSHTCHKYGINFY